MVHELQGQERQAREDNSSISLQWEEAMIQPWLITSGLETQTKQAADDFPAQTPE